MGVAESGSGTFPYKVALLKPLVTCPCAFRLRRLAQNGCPGIRVRHFSCKFPYKMALLTCPCGFRLRRLAQSVVPALGTSYVCSYVLSYVCSHLCALLRVLSSVCSHMSDFLCVLPYCARICLLSTLFGVSCWDNFLLITICYI